MEISNRKLFSRGMVAIGFAVAVSGIPGDAFAADQPETAAVVATAQKEDNELSEREKHCVARNSRNRMPGSKPPGKWILKTARRNFRP